MKLMVTVGTINNGEVEKMDFQDMHQRTIKAYQAYNLLLSENDIYKISEFISSLNLETCKQLIKIFAFERGFKQ